jgi:hypothetical protein
MKIRILNKDRTVLTIEDPLQLLYLSYKYDYEFIQLNKGDN